MRIVTGSAAHLSLLEALRPLQRFHDECGLTEAPVLVKPDPRKLAERNAGIVQEKLTRARIVQFTMGAGGTDRGLHVTLRADANEIAVTSIVEIHRRGNGSLRVKLGRGHVRKVLRRRTVTHLTVNAWLSKLHIFHVEAAVFYISQLAGVTDGADGLIAGGSAEFLPGAQISAFAGGTIDDPPVIDPPFLQGAVLDWKDMDLAVGQLGGIGLLEL